MLTGAPSCFYKLYSRSTVVHFAKEKICLNLLARLSVSSLVRFAQHSDPVCACALLSMRPRGEKDSRMPQHTLQTVMALSARLYVSSPMMLLCESIENVFPVQYIYIYIYLFCFLLIA